MLKKFQRYMPVLLTDRRNEILYLTGSLIILPAYAITTMYLVDVMKTIPTFGLANLAWLGYGLFIFAFLPQLASSTSKKHWHTSFGRQWWVFSVSLLAIITFIKFNQQVTLHRFWSWFMIVCLFEGVRLLIARGKREPDKKAVTILLILITVGWGTWVYRNTLSTLIGQNFGLSIFVTIASLLFLFQSIIQANEYYRKEKSLLFNPDNELLKRWYVSLIRDLLAIVLLAYFFIYLGTPSLDILCITVYAGMLLAADPAIFISVQRSHLRRLTRGIRHDYIHRLITPTLAPSHFLSRAIHRIRYLWRKNGGIILLITLFVAPTILSSILYFVLQNQNLGELLLLGPSTGILLTIFYVVIVIIYYRPKHIVTPFAPTNDSDTKLKLLAEVITQSFVKNLRYVTLLLNARQAENLYLRHDPNLAIFVTSKQEQEPIEHLQSLGNIEIGQLNLRLGNTLSVLFTQLARTRVQGTLQRRDDQTVAISLEFSERGGRTVSVDIDWIPENTVHDTDQTIIDELTRNLAVKLIVSLGHATHLASNWQSLRYFVDGLSAAYLHNWTHAIACYRKAIEIEETYRGGFGTGYYHLGAATVLQGHLAEGLKYLEKADAYGPPNPENSYMLAITLFSLNREFLHNNPSIFTAIYQHCLSAISLQAHFPEAHHLLGAAYYQRGKLRERSYRRRPKLQDEKGDLIVPQPRYYRDDFKLACYHLGKAIKQYDIFLRHISEDVVAAATIFDEQGRLTQSRMSATHRLADALRFLERFAEAESYYEDVLTAYPDNIQSKIDIGKTYCISENWQRAEELTRHQTTIHRESRWHKSINLYKGWSLMGGIAEELSIHSQWLNFIILFYAEGLNAFTFLKKMRRRDHYMKLLGKAMIDLDFALYQFPGYEIGTVQCNWLDSLQIVVDHPLFQNHDTGSLDQIYRQPLKQGSEFIVAQHFYWLAWRIDATLYREVEKKVFPHSMIGDTRTLPQEQYPEPEFSGVYGRLRSHRDFFKLLLIAEELDRRVNRFSDTVEWLKHGYKLYLDWQDAKRKFESLRDENNDKQITFSERWTVDIFAELSILTIRILAEAGAYSLGKRVALQALTLIQGWMRRWLEKLPNFTFSDKVARFQLATLHTWYAYCQLNISCEAVMAENVPIYRKKLADLDFIEINNEIKRALEYAPGHSLAIYVGSLIQNPKEFNQKAAYNLSALLAEKAAFNPHRNIQPDQDESTAAQMNDQMDYNTYTHRDVGRLSEEARETQEITSMEKRLESSRKLFEKADTRIKLYYQDRVSGNLQLQGPADQVVIHTRLAEIYAKLERPDLSSKHMLYAVALTPYRDVRSESLLILAHYLDNYDQPLEAKSAVEEVVLSHYQLSPLDCLTMHHFAPRAFGCVVATNLEDYQHALENAGSILDELSYAKFLDQQIEIVNEITKQYLGSALNTNFDNSVVNHPECQRINQCLRDYLNILINRKAKNMLPSKEEVADLVSKSYMLFEKISVCPDLTEENHTHIWLNSLGQQSVAIIVRNACEYAYLLCEVKNNIAFNSVELGLNQENNVKYADYAVSVLNRFVDRQPQFIPWNLSKRLGQYYDTQAWAMFRQATSDISKVDSLKSLQRAQDLLKNAQSLLIERALSRDTSSAITYYHLSRISVAQLELIWQGLPASQRKSADVKPEMAHEITVYLRQALLSWRQAKRLAKGGSLTARLRLVRQRIVDYRRQWAELQVPNNHQEDNEIK